MARMNLISSEGVMTSNKEDGVRLVRPEDIKRLCEIYAYYVEDSEAVVSFEIVAPDFVEFKRRVVSISRNFPYIVYQESGTVLGFAYAHPCFERAAYRWSLETTIYLAPDVRGRGVGRLLYSALIDLCRELGFRNLYAVIVKENAESCAFHERIGFKEMALFRSTGWKSGRWLDVVWYELQIGTFDTPPGEPISISRLSTSAIDGIIKGVDRK